MGNLVPLLALRRFQLLGHHPIAVAGGATGSIGDPSGKTPERQLLTREVLDANIASVKEQLQAPAGFRHQDQSRAAGGQRHLDGAASATSIFCATSASIFPSTRWWPRKASARAWKTAKSGISYTEFSYMLLQAFDFYICASEYNCELQIGGSDQWGNITAGIDLIRKKLGKPAFGLTLPLITNADGTKFGKTDAGAVWLDPKKTSVYRFYQFWINTDDRDVVALPEIFHLSVAGRNRRARSRSTRKTPARARRTRRWPKP